MRSTKTGLLNKKRKGNCNNPQGTEIVIGERGKVQGRVLVLVGGRRHTGYAYALAQVLHEKHPCLFLLLKGMRLKNCKGIEKCPKKFG